MQSEHTAAAAATETGRDLPRTIGFWGASAVMVGVMIGSGIFATPPGIAEKMGSPMLVLALWAAGGVLALMGALTFAELAAMYPRSGGVYVFLREGFGAPVAFVFGWTYILLSKPLAAAGIAVVFATYLNNLLGTTWDPAIATCLAIVLLTYINARGVRLGTDLAVVLTGCKMLALGAIVVLALVLVKGDAANFADQPQPGHPTFWLAVVPVMAAILWTYDGWSDVGAIAGEVKNPQRMLPRIYLVGTAAVTVLYVAINAVYYWMLPVEQIAGSKTVAPLVMERLLGPQAGVAVSLLVVVSSIGSTHSSIMTGARVTFAQARDGLMFGFLGTEHKTHRTPAVALWVQAALSCTAALWLGTFERLAGGFVFTMWIWYGLGGIAIFVLRIKRPDAYRPYRCWGYPVVPAVFVLSAVAMTGLSVWQDPGTTRPWLGVLAAALPVYFGWKWLGRRQGTKVG